MKYLEYVNSKIKTILAEAPQTAVYGQNINAGSCIGGYTRGLQLPENGLVLNTPNSENSLVGVGFGLMLSGVNAVFFMKQLDFLLLGLDHIVNTHNIVRTTPAVAAFSILPIIVDSGYDGPQSSLNTLSDFCSISSTDGYTLTNKHDIDFVLENFMLSPGFRIIGFSQRLIKSELISFDEKVTHSENGSWFQYTYGSDMTIACFNLSLPQGLLLTQALKAKGIMVSLFSINPVLHKNWQPLLLNYQNSGHLLILDDTKSASSPSQQFSFEAMQSYPHGKVRLEKRQFSESWFVPSSDEFNIDLVDISHWYKGI